MFKNIIKVAAVATVISFGGVTLAGPITASSAGGSSVSATKSAQKVAKAAAKQAKKALKAYKKCMKRAAKGKVSAASCGGGSSVNYSLVSPVTTVAAASSGPSCTTNCTSALATTAEGGTATPTAVPEPTTLALLGAGLLGMGLATRRRRIAG